jgi:hypothetical protein
MNICRTDVKVSGDEFFSLLRDEGSIRGESVFSVMAAGWFCEKSC